MNKQVNRRRRPAFRTPEPKAWQKPLFFIRDKWLVFQGYSRKKKFAIIGGTTAVVLILIPPLSYLYFVRDINDRERLMNRNSTGITITDRNDEVIYSNGRTPNEKFYNLDEISDDMEQALLASEDKDFYEHGGFSVPSIAGALIGNILNLDADRYGGSTLTQQLVKNNLLTNNKNYLRKYQELSIAIAIERTYTKDEILAMYLNSVYYGEGAFGIGRAAEVYFDKTPQELTLAESSVLVGLLPAPSAFSPISGDAELSKREQDRVLAHMVEIGYITDTQKETALSGKLKYSDETKQDQEYANHFVAMVLDDLREQYGEERVARAGFQVKSTLDLSSQKHAEQAIKDQIAAVKSQGANNAALVALDPKNGELIALVGSVDWQNKKFGQVNMATTPRQPGSSFKPIFYAEALDKRVVTASTIIRDERKTYGGNYQPENYDFRYRGDITVRHALATSLNIPAIEVMQKLGVEESVEASQRMGLDTINDPESYGLSLALGTAEAELLKMTSAYGAFANEGSLYKPTMVLSINDKYGKEITYKHDSPTTVQSREASYVINSILSDEGARAPLSGAALNLSGRKVAVKTGTTNDNIDAWTIGYTPSLAVGVWVGDNDHKPMTVGGTAAAGPIWRSTMQHILADSASLEFQRPSQVVEQALCSVNGTYYEYYIQGTEPRDHCHIPTQAEIDAQKRREEEEKRQQEEERKRQEQEDEETNEPPSETEEPQEPVDEQPEEEPDPDTEEPPAEEPVL